MRRQRLKAFGAPLGVAVALTSACSRSLTEVQESAAHVTDAAAFAALETRAQEAMDVDQYISVHLFDALPDRGRIERQRDSNDFEAIELHHGAEHDNSAHHGGTDHGPDHERPAHYGGPHQGPGHQPVDHGSMHGTGPTGSGAHAPQHGPTPAGAVRQAGIRSSAGERRWR